MVTKVAGNQGQITLKGVPITDEWQQLVTVAAKRNGQTFAEFVADVTRAAALAIVKGEAAVTAAVPARIEDVAASLHEQIVQLAERQHVDLAQLAIDQKERLARIERHARRGRWRRG